MSKTHKARVGRRSRYLNIEPRFNAEISSTYISQNSFAKYCINFCDRLCNYYWLILWWHVYNWAWHYYESVMEGVFLKIYITRQTKCCQNSWSVVVFVFLLVLVCVFVIVNMWQVVLNIIYIYIRLGFWPSAKVLLRYIWWWQNVTTTDDRANIEQLQTDVYSRMVMI